MSKMPKINDKHAKKLMDALATMCCSIACSGISCDECALDGFSERKPENTEGVIKLFDALHNVTCNGGGDNE